jgi:chromosome partitioning protein
MFPFATVSRKPDKGDRAGVVLAVCSAKGGVGKTTTAVNLADGLAREEDSRVLLIDADPQGHAGACVPILSAEELEHEPTDLATLVLRHQAELLEAVWPTSIEGLHVVPAGDGLREAEQSLSSRIGKETVLRGALEVTRTHFDFVVIDCPPSLSTLAIASLAACDGVIIPCELSALTVRGLEELVGALAQVHQRLNSRLGVLGIVINRLDSRNSRANAEVIEELQEFAGGLLFSTTIRSSTALPRAQHQAMPVSLFPGRGEVAVDYELLVDEVRARLATRPA